MNAERFCTELKKASRLAVITRPQGNVSFDVNIASSIDNKDYSLIGDATQESIDLILCNEDFRYQTFTSPRKGDRITDDNGDTFVIDNIKIMRGSLGAVYGYKCRVIS